MERFSQARRLFFGILGIFLGAGAVILMSGCQIDVSGGIGAKAFYPDNAGESRLGDPRRPMYDGSGYVDRHTAGNQSEFQGFKKMGGGDK